MLPSNFVLKKYGLDVRFVNTEDAQFIVDLRTDPSRSRYISYTDNSVESQIKWIKSYKEREKLGLDYYFIYSYEGIAAGVNRIYDINNNHFVHGSWVFSDAVPPFCSLAAAIIAREIAFDTLGMDEEIDTVGIHEDNKGVIQVSKMLGVNFFGKRESDIGTFILGRLPKETFNLNKKNILKYVPQKYL